MTKTIALKTALQAHIWTNFLVPQLIDEDGFWATAKPAGHGVPWAEATVVVDPENPGVDFVTSKNNYDFTNKDLVDDYVDGWLADIKERGLGDLTKSKLRRELQVIRETVKVIRGASAQAETTIADALAAGFQPELDPVPPAKEEDTVESIMEAAKPSIPSVDELQAMSNAALVELHNELAPAFGALPLSPSWAKRSKSDIVTKVALLA